MKIEMEFMGGLRLPNTPYLSHRHCNSQITVFVIYNIY